MTNLHIVTTSGAYSLSRIGYGRLATPRIFIKTPAPSCMYFWTKPNELVGGPARGLWRSLSRLTLVKAAGRRRAYQVPSCPSSVALFPTDDPNTRQRPKPGPCRRLSTAKQRPALAPGATPSFYCQATVALWVPGATPVLASSGARFRDHRWRRQGVPRGIPATIAAAVMVCQTPRHPTGGALRKT